jgi:hypothetical protein
MGLGLKYVMGRKALSESVAVAGPEGRSISAAPAASSSYILR